MSAQAGVPTREASTLLCSTKNKGDTVQKGTAILMGMPHATHTFSLTEFSHISSFSVKQHHNSSHQPPAAPILSPSLDMSFDFL